MTEYPGLLDAIRPILKDPTYERKAVDLIMGYYFRVWKWEFVRRSLQHFCNDGAKNVKRTIPVGYRFLCLKMAVTDMRVNSVSPDEASRRNNVHPDDVPILHYVRSLPFYVSVSETYPYMTPAEVRQLAFQAVTMTRRMAQDFIHRRMRFLYSHAGISYEDIISLFRIRAITLVYTFYPALSGEHLMNMIRKDIGNYGLNQIESCVRERRGICSPQEDGNGVRLNIVEDTTEADRRSGRNETTSEVELRILVEHFCKNGSEEQKELMQFLSFNSPRREKDFVMKYGVGDERTCEDVCERVGMRRFRTAVLNFLGLSRESLAALHDSLRSELVVS